MKIFTEENNRDLYGIILDINNHENVVLVDDEGNKGEYHQLWYNRINESFYCVLKFLVNSQKVVFKLEKKNGSHLVLIENEQEVKEILSMYSNACKKFISTGERYHFNDSSIRRNETNNQILTIKAIPKREIELAMSAKGRKSVMSVLIISYVLLFIAGVILLAIPQVSSVFVSLGICEEMSARAYSVTIGLMWIALAPTLGYYFATISPYEVGKKAKVILAVISTILHVAMNVAFFVVINIVELETIIPELKFSVKTFYEGSDTWFIPVSMIFASLGIIVCYVLTLFKIKPDKIKDIKPERKGNGLFEVIKYGFIYLGSLILRLSKAILKFKEKQPELFILISSILLTWFVFFTAFIFSIICLTVLVGAIIMYFAGVLHLASDYKSSPKIVEIVDCGTTKILTYNPHIVEDRFEEVYEESNGMRWYSRDGSQTVYKK